MPPLPGTTDTIAAIATPPGRGALALIRLSGPEAERIGRQMIQPWPVGPRQATVCAITDPRSGLLLDRAVALRYEGPHSYTGEDLIEVSTHGGALVPATVLGAMVAAGARVATPGEFTRRALLNGKMDLVQVEAVVDLIDARSRHGQRIALGQLDGSLSRRILELRSNLLDVEAMIAYDIDFPEEDDGPVDASDVLAACDLAICRLRSLQSTASFGELIREGVTVVLAGLPNVGKSSLFNAILGQPRAIVTDQPGTTRDALEAVVDVSGWGLRLVDTAGLRETGDVVERLGVEVSERYLGHAAVILVCGDSADSLVSAEERVSACSQARRILVRTKSDIGDATEIRRELDSTGYQLGRELAIVSSESGAGLAELLEGLVRLLQELHADDLEVDAPVLMRERHRHVTAEALRELELFRTGWISGELPAPVAATHLKVAIGYLEEVIGAVDVEDLLDRLFSTFCVGK